MQFEIIHGHTFLKRFLGRKSVVVDLGANQGAFASGILEKFGCRVLAVEANPVVYAQIPPHDGLQKFNLAIAARSGTVAFWVSHDSQASSLDREAAAKAEVSPDDLTQISVEAQRLEEFCAAQNLTRIDLLKIDIEGAEIEVLDGCSDAFLRSIGQISVEFHDFNNTTPRAEVERVIARLKKLEFAPIKLTRDPKSHVDTLFINRRIYPLSQAQLGWARGIDRNWLGVRRLVQRQIEKFQQARSSDHTSTSTPGE